MSHSSSEAAHGITSAPPSIRIQDLGRTAIAKDHRNSITILYEMTAGDDSHGWSACCAAPSCCSTFGVMPCFHNSEYITLRHESSKYIYVRENSLEWNDPKIILNKGPCCGIDPCMYNVQDRVTVLYYDNSLFENISDKTRWCNNIRTCMCGGRGERIQLDSRCCFDLFYYSSVPCCCAPLCCPYVCTPPCAYRKEIFVKDAQKSIYEISKALDMFRKK